MGFPANTLVHTSRGLVRISALNPGRDLASGPNYTSNKVVGVTVTENSPLAKVTLSIGKEVIVSQDQNLLVCKSLEGDYEPVAVNVADPVFPLIFLEEPCGNMDLKLTLPCCQAYILGYMLSKSFSRKSDKIRIDELIPTYILEGSIATRADFLVGVMEFIHYETIQRSVLAMHKNAELVAGLQSLYASMGICTIREHKSYMHMSKGVRYNRNRYVLVLPSIASQRRRYETIFRNEYLDPERLVNPKIRNSQIFYYPTLFLKRDIFKNSNAHPVSNSGVFYDDAFYDWHERTLDFKRSFAYPKIPHIPTKILGIENLKETGTVYNLQLEDSSTPFCCEGILYSV